LLGFVRIGGAEVTKTGTARDGRREVGTGLVKALYVVGGSLTLHGLVVVLIATIRFMVLDEEVREAGR
jgi:hypothetical protein